MIPIQFILLWLSNQIHRAATEFDSGQTRFALSSINSALGAQLVVGAYILNGGVLTPAETIRYNHLSKWQSDTFDEIWTAYQKSSEDNTSG